MEKICFLFRFTNLGSCTSAVTAGNQTGHLSLDLVFFLSIYKNDNYFFKVRSISFALHKVHRGNKIPSKISNLTDAFISIILLVFLILFSQLIIINGWRLLVSWLEKKLTSIYIFFQFISHFVPLVQNRTSLPEDVNFFNQFFMAIIFDHME